MYATWKDADEACALAVAKIYPKQLVVLKDSRLPLPFQGGDHILAGAHRFFQSEVSEPESRYSWGLEHRPLRIGFVQMYQATFSMSSERCNTWS